MGKLGMLCLVVLLGTTVTQAQKKDWGIGLRGGDPSGITLKKYMGGNALEINVGRTHTFSGRGWYDNRFHEWYHDNKYDYKEFNYVGYRSSMPLAIQVHYLWQKSLNRVADANVSGLDWYVGLGGQIRMQSYTFDYRYKIKDDPNWFYAKGDKVTDLDLGVDGVIGLEYNFEKIPIALFVDATVFMEIVDRPFYFWMQGGLGVRYNF